MSKLTKCKFCNSTKCKVRIVSKDKTYDEVACDHHIHDLERDADKILGNRIRTHITSSLQVKRGEKI